MGRRHVFQLLLIVVRFVLAALAADSDLYQQIAQSLLDVRRWAARQRKRRK